MTEWNQYLRTNVAEMRPYEPGESLKGISVSPTDTPEPGGMIARNPKNHEDQWYVAKSYFEDNFTLANNSADRIEKVAIACRAAYANYMDDLPGLVPWHKSKAQKHWRVVAKAAIATINSPD